MIPSICRLITFSFILFLFTSKPVSAAVSVALGDPLIAPGDPVVAFDLDTSTFSFSPANESVDLLLDEDPFTKYLNFGVTNTGFIVQPSAVSVLQSFEIATANDVLARDPASYVLYGTNDPITSQVHSNGREENWTEISSDILNLPEFRETIGPTVSTPNSMSYSAYKMIFPTVKGPANAMQLADIYMYETLDGSGANILQPNDFIIPIRDVDEMSGSDSPPQAGPELAIDGVPETSYFNFGKENSGLIVTPSIGASHVDSFQITTSSGFPDRDPTSWALYGTNDDIVTPNNGIGNAENWVLIDSGALNLPVDRLTASELIPVNHVGTMYKSYRMVFPTGDPAAILTQIAELQLFGTAVPEPSSVLLAIFGAAAVAWGVRSRRC